MAAYAPPDRVQADVNDQNRGLRMPTHTDVAARRAGDPEQLLLIEPDHLRAQGLTERLRSIWPQLRVVRMSSLPEAGADLGSEVDCVLLAADAPQAASMDALALIRSSNPDLPVVMLVGDGDDRSGVAALSIGAQDYVWRQATPAHSLARAIRHSVQRKRAERYARELAMLRYQSAETRRVQRGLMPRFLLDDPRVLVRHGYRPGDRRQVLGGDFLDVVQNSPARLHIVLGDVCGHGPDEAALGVQLRIAWRTLILAGVEQSRLLETLDRLTSQERHAEHVYATLASVQVDLNTGTARVALAGHPPPLLASADGVQLLTAHSPGPPLGIGLPPRWDLHEMQLGQQWTMLLYSDGIYEGHVVSRGVRLGIEGLVNLLSGAGPDAIWELIPDGLLDRVEALNDGPLEDDVALLAVRCERG